MTKEEIGFTKGAGCAIAYAIKELGIDAGKYLYDCMGIPMEDYKKHCAQIDVEQLEGLGV